VQISANATLDQRQGWISRDLVKVCKHEGDQGRNAQPAGGSIPFERCMKWLHVNDHVCNVIALRGDIQKHHLGSLAY